MEILNYTVFQFILFVVAVSLTLVQLALLARMVLHPMYGASLIPGLAAVVAWIALFILVS